MKRPSRHARRTLATGCLLACLPLAGGAATEVAVQAGTSLQSVHNPFLFPDNSNDPLHRNDTVLSTDIGAAVRVPLPSDRSALSIGATASRRNYDALPQLDHTATQLDMLYSWEYGSLLRGRLQHRQDERLYNYYGGFFTQPETPRSRSELAEVALRITPELSVPVTFTQGALKYGNASLSQRYNLEDHGLQLALSYNSGRKSTLAAGVRQNKAEFPNRSPADVAAIDSGYTDREAFVDVGWRYSEATILHGRIGRLERRFDSLAQRDTSLVSLDAGVDMHYSPKTFLALRGYRRPQSNEQADIRLYVVSTGLEGRADWAATEKTRFSLTAAREQQKYQNYAGTGTGPGGKDEVTRLSARVEYSPFRNTVLRLEGLREHYVPDPAVTTTGDFTRSTLLVGLLYTFENMQGANRARTQLDNMRFQTAR